MEWEYPNSCGDPAPLNPPVLPSHTLRVVLTPGWSDGREERPPLIPTLLPAPSGAEEALGGPAEPGSTPKTWANPKANVGPPTLTSGGAPVSFPSRSASPRFRYFSIHLWLYFWKGFSLLPGPGCSQPGSSSCPLTLELDEGVFPGSLGLWDRGMIPVINS